jgi:hypothetical protein
LSEEQRVSEEARREGGDVYLSFGDLEVVDHEDCADTGYARCSEEDLALE